MLLIIQAEWGETPPMASPGELVETMAAAVGLPRATLVSHDRLLSEAGLRTKSGRGRGAAKVTARDAAHLLTAVLASAEVRDSVHSVRRYAESRARPAAAGQGAGFERLGIPELAALPADSSFLDALERLIAATAHGSLRDAMRGDRVDEGADVPAIPIIEILAETSGTIAEIRVADAGRTASVIYTLPDPPASARASARRGKPFLAASVTRLRSDRDLAQQRRVSAHTLVRIGALLADKVVLP